MDFGLLSGSGIFCRRKKTSLVRFFFKKSSAYRLSSTPCFDMLGKKVLNPEFILAAESYFKEIYLTFIAANVTHSIKHISQAFSPV
jgi:hypothetical protein